MYLTTTYPFWLSKQEGLFVERLLASRLVIRQNFVVTVIKVFLAPYMSQNTKQQRQHSRRSKMNFDSMSSISITSVDTGSKASLIRVCSNFEMSRWREHSNWFSNDINSGIFGITINKYHKLREKRAPENTFLMWMLERCILESIQSISLKHGTWQEQLHLGSCWCKSGRLQYIRS